MDARKKLAFVFLLASLFGLAAYAQAQSVATRRSFLCYAVKSGTSFTPNKGVSVFDLATGATRLYDTGAPTKICVVTPDTMQGSIASDQFPRVLCYRARLSKGQGKSSSKKVTLGGEVVGLMKGREVCLLSSVAVSVSASVVARVAETVCPPTLCGNGTLDRNEECDDGNTVAGDGCSPFCTVEACGSGVIDPGEQCDFPQDQRCPGFCNFDCTCVTGADFFPNMTVILTLQVSGENITGDIVLVGSAEFDPQFGGIGDTNGNGRDELPFTVAFFDASSVNSDSAFGSVRVTLRRDDVPPFHSSSGIIEEDVNATPNVLDIPPLAASGTAHGSTNLFLEFHLDSFSPPFDVLHNEAPLTLTASLTREPPAEGEPYAWVASTTGVPLVDESGHSTPVVVTTVRFIPNPSTCGNGVLDFGETCDPSVPFNFLCVNDQGNVGVCAADCTCSVP